MLKFRSLIKIISFFILIGLVYPQRADAYIDPGTGSFVLQLIAGFLIGASLTIRIYWKKMRSFFDKYFKKDDSRESDKEEIDNI